MSYIEFIEIKDTKTKTKQFYIRNKNSLDILGYIIFYSAWRKFVFKPASTNVIFDTACLKEIMDFCQEQTSEWKLNLSK